VDEVAAVLRGLPGLISEIRSFKCGPDVGVNAGNWDFAVIVSLLPWATEIVYALGLGDQLEGRTFECHYPPEAQQKLIVSSSGLPENLVEEALGRLGCRAEVVSLDPHSLDDVMSDIQNVARAAGVNARADLLVDNLRARMAAVEASVSLASAGRVRRRRRFAAGARARVGRPAVGCGALDT
jgi:ABC-type hemin transport system substrate-binding protein